MKEPKKLAKPDWADVHELICEHVQSVVDGEMDAETSFEDQRQIFMAVLEAVFGDGAPDWYEQTLGAFADADAEDDMDAEDEPVFDEDEA